MGGAGPARAAAALLALLLLPAPVLAQPSAGALRDARRAEQESREAAAAAARAAREARETAARLAPARIEAARRAQEAEAVVDAALDRVLAAEAAMAEAEAEAARRAAALAPLVPAMRRLALWPAETLLVVPLPPEEALRGALVLRSLARRVQEDLLALREAREEAARRAEAAAAEAARLVAARGAALEAAAALEAEIAAIRQRGAELDDAAARAARRAQAAAAEARDLAEALTRLEREEARAAREEAAREQAERRRRRAAREPEPAPEPVAVEPARGGRAMPVAGRVSRDWGAPGDGGPARGLTFAAPPGATVVSPCAGRAVFGAPFRSYGLMLIVDCGGGTHVVLAGLDRLDTAAGSRVAAGEPVGALGLPEGDGRSGRAALYLELRRNGQPVDPRPWLASRS